MSMDRNDIIKWLKTLPKGANVGIDSGGLTLLCEEDMETYLEIGGLQEGDDR